MKHPSRLKVDAIKTRGIGDFPNFIHLGHRHLQKEKPDGIAVVGGEEFVLPLDLLRMTVSPALLNDIEEVRLAYKKR